MRKFFLLLLLLTGTSFLLAQEESTEIKYDSLKVLDYENPREYIIQDVTVSGIKYIQKEVLVSLSGLKAGNTITLPGDDVTKVLTKFWEQGLFSDIKITASRIEGNKVWIDIYLREQPRMLTLNIDGISKTESQDLLEKINLRNGQQITADILDNTKRIITDHFIDKGFLNSEVIIHQEMDSVRVNMVNLNIEINKNDRIRIDEIYFEGNEVFSDQRLRRVMKNTKKVNLNIFKASKIISEKIKEDKESLVKFYNENGYRDAKVLSDSMAFSEEKEKRVDLFIELEEGNKYYVGDIEWIGNTKYPAEILSTVLGIEKGDVFDQSIFDERLFYDEDAVNSIYLNNGYLFFEMTPVEVSVENDTIDFEIRIREGEQATVNRVIITGNTKTNEHVARREIWTKPGDLFSKQDIIRSVRELASLGHFDPEQIEPNPIPNAEDGSVDIEYRVVERANDQLEVSGGYGAGMLIFTAGIRFSNFSMRRLFDKGAWRPVPSGDGQTLSLRAQTNGQFYQSYNFSFVEPWLGGKKRNSFSVSLFHSKMNKNYYSYWNVDSEIPDEYMKITGASVGLGRRLNWPDDFFTLQHSLSYQRYKLKDFQDFLAENGTFNNLSLTNTLGRNSTDQPIYPRRGSNLSLSLQLTPPYSLLNNTIDYVNAEDEVKYKWVEYHRWMFKADWYKTIVQNLVFYTRMHFGYLGMYNPDYGPSPFESFDVGGDGLTGYNLYGRETIAMRGYENGYLTPRLDYDTDELINGINGRKSGNVYTKFTMEIRYPISLNPSATIFALVFAEGGNAWYSIDDFNPFQAKRSAGVGLRAFLPMFGLLGVDWAYGFDEAWEGAGISGSQFHFTIGQQF
ncbi:MAG: outer membrane protein assembly factor BamA [Bacteroidales bacterium]|nr:outer membrane protein assembly factor BamA [Bacteroidales bacterium]